MIQQAQANMRHNHGGMHTSSGLGRGGRTGLAGAQPGSGLGGAGLAGASPFLFVPGTSAAAAASQRFQGFNVNNLNGFQQFQRYQQQFGGYQNPYRRH